MSDQVLQIDANAAKELEARLVDPRAITGIYAFFGRNEPTVAGFGNTENFALSVWASANPRVWTVLERRNSLPPIKLREVDECHGLQDLLEFGAMLATKLVKEAQQAGGQLHVYVQNKQVALPPDKSGPAVLLLLTTWPRPASAESMIVPSSLDLLPSHDEAGAALVSMVGSSSAPSATSPHRDERSTPRPFVASLIRWLLALVILSLGLYWVIYLK